MDEQLYNEINSLNSNINQLIDFLAIEKEKEPELINLDFLKSSNNQENLLNILITENKKTNNLLTSNIQTLSGFDNIEQEEEVVLDTLPDNNLDIITKLDELKTTLESTNNLDINLELKEDIQSFIDNLDLDNFKITLDSKELLNDLDTLKETLSSVENIELPTINNEINLEQLKLDINDISNMDFSNINLNELDITKIDNLIIELDKLKLIESDIELNIDLNINDNIDSVKNNLEKLTNLDLDLPVIDLDIDTDINPDDMLNEIENIKTILDDIVLDKNLELGLEINKTDFINSIKSDIEDIQTELESIEIKTQITIESNIIDQDIKNKIEDLDVDTDQLNLLERKKSESFENNSTPDISPVLDSSKNNDIINTETYITKSEIITDINSNLRTLTPSDNDNNSEMLEAINLNNALLNDFIEKIYDKFNNSVDTNKVVDVSVEQEKNTNPIGKVSNEQTDNTDTSNSLLSGLLNTMIESNKIQKNIYTMLISNKFDDKQDYIL